MERLRPNGPYWKQLSPGERTSLHKEEQLLHSRIIELLTYLTTSTTTTKKVIYVAN